MKTKWVIWFTISILFLSACAVQQNEPEQTTLTGEGDQPLTTMTAIPDIADRGAVVEPADEGGLMITEYPILIKESIEEVLAAFPDADWNSLSSGPYEAQVGEDLILYRVNEILAEDEEDGLGLSRHDVIVYKNDEPILTIPLGTIGPISPTYGIYSDGTAWYLEVDRGESFVGEDGGIVTPNLGDIYRNGESLNEAEDYDVSFGFTFLNGQPFYLFERDGVYGYSLDGVEYALPYTDIWYHRCCSAGLANPRGTDTSVAIFGNIEDQRYLVVLEDDN